jgi:hypothetical protein
MQFTELLPGERLRPVLGVIYAGLEPYKAWSNARVGPVQKTPAGQLERFRLPH